MLRVDFYRIHTHTHIVGDINKSLACQQYILIHSCENDKLGQPRQPLRAFSPYRCSHTWEIHIANNISDLKDLFVWSGWGSPSEPATRASDIRQKGEFLSMKAQNCNIKAKLKKKCYYFGYFSFGTGPRLNNSRAITFFTFLLFSSSAAWTAPTSGTPDKIKCTALHYSKLWTYSTSYDTEVKSHLLLTLCTVKIQSQESQVTRGNSDRKLQDRVLCLWIVFYSSNYVWLTKYAPEKMPQDAYHLVHTNTLGKLETWGLR